jgi:hypothetical protein
MNATAAIMTRQIAMLEPVVLDRHVIDTLMRDMVAHDHAPSAYLVFLWL